MSLFSRDGVLGQRDFRLVFSGQTISSIGDQLFPVAVAGRVLDSGGDEGDLGLVLAGRTLALIFFVVLGGVWADRLSRTRVMISADVMRVVAVLALALTPGDVPVWTLAGLTFLVGGGEAFFRPAYGALLPSIVPRDQLGQANALTSVSLRSAMIVGPGLAGALLQLPGGVQTAFFIDAATFFVSMVTLLRVAEPPMPARDGGKESAVREALAGLQAVRQRPWIGAVLAMAALQLMLAIAPEMVLLPAIAKDRFGGTGAYGSILAIGAVGGVLGALLASHWHPRKQGLVAQLAILPYTLVLVSLALPSPFVLITAAHVVGAFGLEIFLVQWATALQREVPRHLLARVISLDWLFSFSLMPLGQILVGPAVDAFGRPAVLWAGAGVIVVTTLACFAVPGIVHYSTGDPATGGDPPDGEPDEPPALPTTPPLGGALG